MAARRLDRQGYAVVLVLLAITLLSVVGSAALIAAMGQLRAATTAGKVLKMRAGAAAEVEAALVGTRGYPAAQVGDSALELTRRPLAPDGWQRALDLRLSREFHLFLGEAAIANHVPARDGRLVWWMDPETRVAAHGAVVESSAIAVGAGARIASDSILDGRGGVQGCGQLPVLRRVFGGQPVPASASLPPPPRWGAGQDGPDFAELRLGWFGRTALRALADHPISAGASPPQASCTGCWAGLVFSEESTVQTNAGAGVLLVHGNLSFAPGSSWTGLVLVSGDLALGATSVMRGFVRAGGTVTLHPESLVDGSACAALRALEEARSLARPIRFPERSRLGPIAPGVE